MSLKKVTAIFDELRLNDVEQTLIKHGVSGFTLQQVKGRGHYFDSFNEQHLTKHIQLDVYTQANHAKAIAQLIMNTAHVDTDSEGLVCIVPIDNLYWIHDRIEADSNDFSFHQADHE